MKFLTACLFLHLSAGNILLGFVFALVMETFTVHILLLAAIFTGLTNGQNSTRPCGQLASVKHFRDYAEQNIPNASWIYIESYAGYGNSKKWNEEAFSRIQFRSRLMVDVLNRSLSTTVLGQHISFPVGTAPAAAHKHGHPDGEVATAKACAAAGCVMLVSSRSTVTLEDIAEAGGPNLVRWQQLEIFTNRSITLDLVRRAEAVNTKAIVVTVDVKLGGVRYGGAGPLPPGARYENYVRYGGTPVTDLAANWKSIEWLSKSTKLPIVVKGILTGEDAILAVRHGAKAILVSNHGARQLDGSPPTIEALPEVVKAVGGRAEVYLDSGIRSGMDILRALARGAKAVFIGRPLFYGLSYQGETGLKCVLNTLKNELDNVMLQTGETDVANISSRVLRKQDHPCGYNA